jgi:hypothetical protein
MESKEERRKKQQQLQRAADRRSKIKLFQKFYY